jgi:hypothetical protein
MGMDGIIIPVIVTSETHNEVNIRLINSKVALSQRYVQSLIESLPR